MEIFELGQLFEEVQINGILGDGKTFVDCIPKSDLLEINEKFLLVKDQENFNLKAFILQNFQLPTPYGADYISDPQKSVTENISRLWPMLTRAISTEKSSIINLPNRYIVPGGRFREIYYWDSYFTMLGLKEEGLIDLMDDMISNFAFLINEIGHIPNGNRTYYLSRSQPPFFSLMVQLLADTKKDSSIFLRFQKELEKEYEFWMKNASDLKKDEASLRVVCMPDGTILNRYFDFKPLPREESYAEDVHISKSSLKNKSELFTDLRAGAESGWDFSTRWFADDLHIETIETTQIIPIDLNCLLYHLESTIANTATIANELKKASIFSTLAEKRKIAIQQYFWNEEAKFYCDYHFANKQVQNKKTAAAMYPLFMGIAKKEQAGAMLPFIENQLLKPGGIVTSNNDSGQQWDAPNGWAPLQWIASIGLRNYGFNKLSDEIALRWTNLNEKVFAATGKLMEKYNVEDLSKLAGGGEYEGQDGFGWTNGVYLAFKKLLQ